MHLSLMIIFCMKIMFIVIIPLIFCNLNSPTTSYHTSSYEV
jgi:hypothetical protein